MVGNGRRRPPSARSELVRRQKDGRNSFRDDWAANLRQKVRPGLATVGQAVAELLEHSPVSATTAAVNPAETNGAGRFRAHDSNGGKSYRRMADEIARLIVVGFDDRPADDVITLLKDAGFRYRPQYHGQKKVWTRADDFEGRQLAANLEVYLTNRSAGELIPR